MSLSSTPTSPDTNRPDISKLVLEFACYTSTNIFLTGRAGTGKTTLLKKIIKATDKNVAIVAPTGVAAINAGGMTIHSLFQLPTTGFIPNNDLVDPDLFTNKSTLARTQKIRKERNQVLLQLELLIIDEISMVRADLLDAIDMVLKRVRKSKAPFGGVQILAVGDLFQLAPVVKPSSENVLNRYYDSPFFFSALSWKEASSITMELTKIYRQNDAELINVLNNIRTNNASDVDIAFLNTRHLDQKAPEDIITLTTHNATANLINDQKLGRLEEKEIFLNAEITGKFSESAFPADQKIILKKNAQVMFIRNHPEGLYFNGKIGKVVEQDEEEIIVMCQGEAHPIRVSPSEWENIKYEVDKNTKEVEKEKIGSFTQYPLKLAWAVTVHKSQGLTFDQVCLDVNRTFAPGQLYVALSRCTTLEGMYLNQPIKSTNVITDQRIVKYYKNSTATLPSLEHLAKAKSRYEDTKMIQKWNFTNVIVSLEDWVELVAEYDLPDAQKVEKIAKKTLAAANELQIVATKFQSQVKHLIQEYQEDDAQLHTILERCKKAVKYFSDTWYQKVVEPVDAHYKEFRLKGKVKRYRSFLENLYNDSWRQLDVLYKMKYRDINIYEDTPQHVKVVFFDPNDNKTKAKKGKTYDITLELHEEGNSIEEIAKLRSMSPSTIEGHYSKLIKEGKVDINDLLDKDVITNVTSYLVKHAEKNMTDIKSLIPFETSYAMLRWIKADMDRNKT